MENLTPIEKTQKNIKILTWILLVGSGLILLWSLFMSVGFINMIHLKNITKNFDPPIQINFTLYFILTAIKLLLSILIFLSSIFVLKYNDNWRKVLIYVLFAAILFLLIAPIVNYFNFPMQNFVAPKGMGKEMLMEKEMLNMAKSSMLIFSYILSFVIIAFNVYAIKKMTNKEVVKLFI